MISRKHKLIFVHIPKAAGSSMNAFLKTVDSNTERLALRQHEPISYIKENYATEFATCFTFSIVRNPWDRVVSLYHYRRTHFNQGNPHWPDKHDIKSMSFRDVVLRSHEQNPKHSETCPPRDVPETAWLEPSCFAWINIDGKIAVDYVCKMESIQTDVATMCKTLEIEPPPFPHANKSKHKHYTEYYDDETREIIAKRYAKDIEVFGYEFGGKNEKIL